MEAIMNKSKRAGIEIEVYDTAHIANIMDLVDMGVFKKYG